MKLIKLFSIASLIALAGCSSKVVTYDTAGQVIGSCVATQGFILGLKLCVMVVPTYKALTILK